VFKSRWGHRATHLCALIRTMRTVGCLIEPLRIAHITCFTRLSSQPLGKLLSPSACDARAEISIHAPTLAWSEWSTPQRAGPRLKPVSRSHVGVLTLDACTGPAGTPQPTSGYFAIVPSRPAERVAGLVQRRPAALGMKAPCRQEPLAGPASQAPRRRER
jgi:hypothetical protein